MHALLQRARYVIRDENVKKIRGVVIRQRKWHIKTLIGFVSRIIVIKKKKGKKRKEGEKSQFERLDRCIMAYVYIKSFFMYVNTIQ